MINSKTRAIASSVPLCHPLLVAAILFLAAAGSTSGVDAARVLIEENLRRNLFDIGSGKTANVLVKYRSEAGKQLVESTCNSTRQGLGLKRVGVMQATLASE